MMMSVVLMIFALSEALVYPQQSRCVSRRMRSTKGPEESLVLAEELVEQDANERLRKDIERFREEAPQVPREEKGVNPLISVINFLGAILSVNFVVIFGLFLYFLYGVFALYALKNEAPILFVKASFDPYILPILSTHMGLTFLSAGLERVVGTDEN